ncbi:hypothetical protein M8J77_000259 [Diaphorina citri]|jgi:Protein of unknown function (DUF1358).|nr:hypothetical protein M8J77_000259 [Diaphorina citri]
MGNSDKDDFEKFLENNSSTHSEINQKYKWAGILYLTSIAGGSAIFAFSSSLASVKRKDPEWFAKGTETGTSLALRAFKWGSFYSITGCSIFFYGIWKLTGAANMQEFRYKLGTFLPRIKKNDPPQSRTEFDGLTDLLTYLSTDYSEQSKTKSFKS